MKNENTEGLDIAGLLALKAFEHPDANRIEKNVQSTMRAVRVAHGKPSLLFFPDKSLAWMFAQPRYGIAALFILFLGLHLMSRPMSAMPLDPTGVEPSGVEIDIASVVGTNVPPPIVIPAMQPNYSSLIHPVSFTD